MARTVEQMPPGSHSRAAKYPWGQWFDGHIWELTRGDDFTCSPRIMSIQAHTVAKRRGLRVRVAVRGDRVYVQSRDASSEDGDRT